LKSDLLRPEAYDLAEMDRPGRPESVELVETHISWVMLLDRDVFKVKKPVNLGFVDFRTRKQRRAACEAEVLLNRRLAPDVYLGTVAVRRGEDGRARMGGSGPIVDWAVHMRRLPDEARADHLLAGGELSPGDVDAIATRLAAFHAECPSNDVTRTFGGVPVIERNVEENFEQTRAVLPLYLAPEESSELLRWQRAFLRAHGPLFEKRATEGFVRDGHGDLRLEHVYLENGRVTVLDCIEFNDRLRFADVCADVAFLSMDLAAHDRVDLAERLLAVYAREANDFDLYALVDFYASYRAFVRGKIAAMVAADPTIEQPARDRVSREARRYFLLGLSADRRSLLAPAVVAVGGIIASGKSTIAQRIGAEMGAPVIDADRTRKAMLGVEPTTRIAEQPWSGAYDPEFTESVYREVLRRAEVVLESGRPVVLDASFRSASMRAAARELAARHGVPFRHVECRVPADVARARLVERERRGGVSDGRLAIFDAFCERFEAARELPEDEHRVVDTTLPPEANVQQLRSYLDMWPPGFAK
jgi:aminoglycoside phosphotransferase family enzyme/predicted kinase